MIVLRLARHLRTRNSPVFNVVAINSAARLTSKPLEVLGTYDPRPVLPPTQSTSPNGDLRGREWGPPQADVHRDGTVGQKKVVWNEERIRWWLSKGAQPSDRVRTLLNAAGILAATPNPISSTQTSSAPPPSTASHFQPSAP